MIEGEEAILNIKRDVMGLTEMPLDVYFNDSEVHVQIDIISSLIWELRNTNRNDKKAMDDRRTKEYLGRIKIDPIIGLAKIMGVKEK